MHDTETYRLLAQGESAESNGDFVSALDQYERALALSNEQRDVECRKQAECRIFNVQLAKHNYKALERLSPSIVSIEPCELLEWYVRGVAHWYSGSLDKALDDHTRACELAEDEGDAEWLFLVHQNRGQILAELGLYQNAADELRHAMAIAREPGLDIGFARSGLAFALGGLGEYERSFLEFRRAILEHPGNAWAFYNRALILELAGEPGKAADNFRQSIEKASPPLTSRKRLHALHCLGIEH